MANIRNGNTFYIDANTAGVESNSLSVSNIRLSNLIVTTTGPSATLTLRDYNTNTTKLSVSINSTLTTQQFPQEEPILFPNGISPFVVTNCVATCVLKESRG